jgi:hypothetical protein
VDFWNGACRPSATEKYFPRAVDLPCWRTTICKTARYPLKRPEFAMLRTVLLILAVVIAGLLVFAATRPDTFTVQRNIAIAAPADKILPLIDDFRNWTAWSPYEKLDPAMQRTFSEPASGVGATYAWSGNGNAGAGSMRITEVAAPSKVALDLDFIRPMKTSNKVEFTLQPGATGTQVTWTIRGPVPYVAKIMHLFFDMDKMIGGDFEKGLADMKAAAEK